jgi:hypothetical protein
MRLDAERFAPVLDDYYRLRGWDPATGRPTRETLERLDLGWAYKEMAAGAAAARERLPPLEPEPPVVDHHHLDPERVGEGDR